MKKCGKIVITIISFIFVLTVVYYIFLFGLFSGLYNPQSKEIVFSQNTYLGLFSIVVDTGDPLSADSWEYRINDSLLSKDYVNMTSHIDTFLVGSNILFLSVARDSNNEDISFSLTVSTNDSAL